MYSYLRSAVIVWLICFLLLVASCTESLPKSPSPTPEIATPTLFEEEATFLDARHKMVAQTIEARGVSDPAVLRAMRSVQRHEFVPRDYLNQAYADHPLPIGYGQTISQPYIVALMTELLELEPGDKVLEIGTGSGYQAAVLAELDDVTVYSIEIVAELAEEAESRLGKLGYDQVSTKQGDGYYGWPEQAPFDAIIVTAAPDHLPSPLVDQIAEDGRIVVPIGPPGGFQTLWKFVSDEGELKAYNLGGVRFVPFTGEGVKMGPVEQSP